MITRLGSFGYAARGRSAAVSAGGGSARGAFPVFTRLGSAGYGVQRPGVLLTLPNSFVLVVTENDDTLFSTLTVRGLICWETAEPPLDGGWAETSGVVPEWYEEVPVSPGWVGEPNIDEC